MSEPTSQKPLDFLTTRPAPMSAAPPAPPPSSTKPGNTFRYILPGVVFVVVVGVIAWVTQFMPSWRGQKSTTGSDKPPGGPAAITFATNKAIWDPNDDEYALEQERGKEGHYDFPFTNTSSAPAEIGLFKRSCDCSNLQVCLTGGGDSSKCDWQEVKESETKGLEVPPGAKGFVRVGWQGRKEPGSRLRLTIDVWHQPKGNMRERQFDKLEVPIVVSSPAIIMPPRINLGSLGPGDTATQEMVFWSSTRDNFELKLGEDSPLFVLEKTPMTPEECKELERRMRKEAEINTRVRKAYKLKLTVHEQAEGKQLDQGPFQHSLSIFLDNEQVSAPLVVGAVKSDIRVGNTEDRGKVDLKTFAGKDGANRVISLWADPQVTLEIASRNPPTLDVKLAKPETTGASARWQLDVTMPPNTHFGPFAEESVIILRVQRPQSKSPRLLRIPVTGNGQS